MGSCIALVLAVLLISRSAGATCNVIPSTDRTFRSEDGFVSRPFARAGDVVVVRHDTPVFDANPAGNAVLLTFVQPGDSERPIEPIPTLEGGPRSGCLLEDCSAGGCSCVSFAFPDTDARVGVVGDSLALTGPVEIVVRSGGRDVARIGTLRVGDSAFTDDLFPHFVALPASNPFRALVGGVVGRVLAAEDTAGNLFVPLDFRGLIGTDERRTRFFEAVVQGLGVGGSVATDVFTPAGQRLPPLVRQPQPEADELLGTADSPESIFRIEKGAIRPGLLRVPGGGPIVVPKVAGAVHPAKQADPGNMFVGDRFAVYEARECDLDTIRAGTAEASQRCVHLNADDDFADYQLLALDLATTGAKPMVIDEVDGRAFAGYPGTFPDYALYSFSATDSLVAFRISEGVIDIDGDGVLNELLRSGAFDLELATRIAEAEQSPRQEVGGQLLAFSQPDGSARDVLWWYRAGSGLPPKRIGNAARSQFFVTRHAVGAFRSLRVHPFDFAVAGDRIAFVVPEAVQGEDLTGDGVADDAAVVLFRAVGEVVTPIQAAMASSGADARIEMTTTLLAFQTERAGSAGMHRAVGVRGLDQPLTPAFHCDDPATGAPGILASSVSDALIPCLRGGIPGRLRVVVVGVGERDLGVLVGSPDDVQVSGSTLALGVDESIQDAGIGADLDGDSQASDRVLHAFHAAQNGLTNFRHKVDGSAPPFLQFIPHGLAVLSGELDPRRTILRDVDEDGLFEEPIAGLGGKVADNCPTLPNPDQTDGDADGIGDACECPVLRVATVRAFAGSRVRVPLDFEPGSWGVAAGNWDIAKAPGALDFSSCQAGPVVRTAQGSLTCQGSGDAVRTVAVSASTRPIPTVSAGEIASYDFLVGSGTAGRRFLMCVEPSSIVFGDSLSRAIACTTPRHCGEVRVDPTCTVQADCNCDGRVNSGDRVCLITKVLDPSLLGTCACEDCNLDGRTNAADAPCVARCAFGDCVTTRPVRP